MYGAINGAINVNSAKQFDKTFVNKPDLIIIIRIYL